MTTPEPMPDAIAKRVAEIKSEFDLGGYFSDPAHTEKAERLLDALAGQLRAALLGHPDHAVGQHRAEAWLVGGRFGWSCLDCTSKAEDVTDATVAERGAEWNSLHPHGLMAPEPVTGATQCDDPRIDAVAEFVRQQFGSRSDSPVALAGHRLIARRFIAAADAADADAGIRRVTLDEAIERAAKLDYDDLRVMRYGLGHAWADAPERVKESARKRVRRTITAGFGGAS